MSFSADKSGEQLIQALRERVYLLVGVVIDVVLLVGYFVFYAPARSSSIYSPAEPFVVIGVAVVILLLSLGLDFYFERKKADRIASEQAKQLSLEKPSAKRIHTLEDGLISLLEVINSEVKNTSNIIIWRVLPQEIVPAMTIAEQGMTLKAIRAYQELLTKIIKAGEAGTDYWDETILCRAADHGKAKRFNEEAWDFINRLYFSPPIPDTSGIGFSANLEDWLIIVSTSSVGDNIPDDYICALEMYSDSDSQNRPRNGFLFQDRHVVLQKVEGFKKLRDRVNKSSCYWYIQDLDQTQLRIVADKIKSFLLQGTYTSGTGEDQIKSE